MEVLDNKDREGNSVHSESEMSDDEDGEEAMDEEDLMSEEGEAEMSDEEDEEIAIGAEKAAVDKQLL